MSDSKTSWSKKLDIFAFTPIPTGSDYSSKRSRYATIAFILLYLGYFGYTLYGFFAQNVPRINQFSNQLDDSLQYPAPSMAFAFLTGDNLNVSFYDPTYFTFNFQQVTVNSNPNVPRNYTTISMSACRPDWLNPSFDVYCPSQNTQMQGLLYGSLVNMYPRMKVTLCNNSTMNGTCAPKDTINWKLMTGRLFVFIKQYDTYDYVTGSNATDAPLFTSYYYFILMDQYNRAEVKIQAEDITINPNLLTSFTNQQMERLSLVQQNFYVSEVPSTTSHDLFVWWCDMQDTSLVTTVAYTTILDFLSDVAAMWGLIFAIFAFYFLRYNQKGYYSEKPHMSNFDDKITPLVVNAEATQPLDRSARQTLVM